MSPALQILLVEDNPADARLTQELLREAPSLEFALVHVDALHGATAILAEREFAVVLLDLSLPDAHGLDTVRRLREHHPRIPIIVLSGLDDEELAVEALHNGAQDYLVKGAGDGPLIARAMRYAIERKRAELQLIEARDLAEAASRAKSSFLANMSHELRTPLNAIIGFSEIIATGLFGADAGDLYRQYAGYINTSGRHLLKLVNEILDLSKSLAEQLELSEGEVDLSDMVRECVEMMSAQAAAKRVTISTTLPDDLPSLTADGLRLKQVMLNLMSNAIKFSEDGGLIEIAIDLPPTDDLTVTVGDHGVGMRPEDVPTALQPFRQVDSALACPQQGTGLGLPLAKMLVEKHGGSFSIDSAPGEGTRVCFILPAWRLLRVDRARLLA